MAGVLEHDTLSLHAVHRFANGACHEKGRLRWPITELLDHVLVGLHRLAQEYPDVESIGIDTWGVDYALLDAEGRLLANPVSYRDDRTAESVERVHARVTPHDLFAVNGLQFLPFTTLYQLEDERRGPLWERAASIVLLPDLVAFALTGVLRTERTIASTTGLLDVHSHEWSTDLLTRLEIPPDRLCRLSDPGTVLGPLRPHVAARLGAPTCVVTTVASHDTASAIAAVPVAGRNFAYVSSGTWSLVGVELDAPILSAAARDANFTNELGVSGRTRFLRNTGGLWLLSESLRWWERQGFGIDFASVLHAASDVTGRWTIDVNDPIFLAPGNVPERIASAAQGSTSPRSPAEIVRCVVDSLAAAYANATRRAAELSGTTVEVVHLVGGGSQNRLLCQSTADAVCLPVVAGPAEATALGNVLVQARAHGAITDSLEAARAIVATSSERERYEPR